MDVRTYHMPPSPSRRKLEEQRRQLLDDLRRANQVYNLSFSAAYIADTPGWDDSEEATRLLDRLTQARDALRDFDEAHPEIRRPEDAPPPLDELP